MLLHAVGLAGFGFFFSSAALTVVAFMQPDSKLFSMAAEEYVSNHKLISDRKITLGTEITCFPLYFIECL